MAQQDWEQWLVSSAIEVTDAVRRREIEDARRQLRSLYLDMLEWCRQEYGNKGHLYALAAYATWWNIPRQLRQPRSQIELAHLLGLADDDLFRKWRPRYPNLFSDERTKSVVERLVLDNTLDIVQARIDVATSGGAQGHQDAKMLLEMAGIYRPKQQLPGQDGDGLRIEINYAEHSLDTA
jgi:hypothetical protein